MTDLLAKAAPYLAALLAESTLLLIVRRRIAADRARVQMLCALLDRLAGRLSGHYSEGLTYEHPLFGPTCTVGRTLACVDGLAVEVSADAPDSGPARARFVVRVRVPGTALAFRMRRRPRALEPLGEARLFERCILGLPGHLLSQAQREQILRLARAAEELDLADGILELTAAPQGEGGSGADDLERLFSLVLELAAVGSALAGLGPQPIGAPPVAQGSALALT